MLRYIVQQQKQRDPDSKDTVEGKSRLPKSCLLTSSCVLCFTQAHTHQTLKHK